jgi:hypothetical protein
MPIEIPVDLVARAYVTQDGEMAWPKDDVLRVLRWAEDVSLPVLGIEVWIASVPGPTIPGPFIYQCDLQQPVNESSAEFASRSNREAAAYIRLFAWDPKDTAHIGLIPFFNITFGERDK